MNWGGLNNALAAWRNGINQLFPDRSTRSDGGYANSSHSSTSEHQPDADGTVDAFDEDRNYLGSSDQDGNATEDRILAALNEDFMADHRAHLIISDRKIRNDQIGNWRIRPYEGSSPHTEHTHRQVHQSLEDDGRPWKFPHTEALLRELQGGDDVSFTTTEFELTDQTADALGKKRGTKMSGATLLQTLTIQVMRGVTAEAVRDAKEAALLAALTASVGVLSHDGAALTDQQAAALTEKVRLAAAEAGAAAVKAITDDLASLREHLGDTDES